MAFLYEKYLGGKVFYMKTGVRNNLQAFNMDGAAVACSRKSETVRETLESGASETP